MGDTPGKSGSYKFVQKNANASRIPGAEWERHKDVILDKYCREKKSLKVVQREMEAEHSFKAT